MSADSTARTQSDARSPLSDGIAASMRLGLAAAILLVGGLGVWAAAASLAGAVIAAGQVVVEGNVKKVQHPTGGVVSDIRVRDGDKVKAGDLQGDRVNLEVTGRENAESVVILLIRGEDHRDGRQAGDAEGRRGIRYGCGFSGVV